MSQAFKAYKVDFSKPMKGPAIDLFATPVRARKVRKGIVAYQYENGVININGMKYVMYSMAEAISKFRKNYPKYYNDK